MERADHGRPRPTTAARALRAEADLPGTDRARATTKHGIDRLTRLAVDARAGDRDALADLVRSLMPDVWRTCRHFGRADTVDDLAQEVFVRVVAALPGFRGESPVRSWVLAIAWRVCADQVRADRRRTALVGRLIARRPTNPHDAAAELDLNDAIDQLDPDRRGAFVLTQLIGLSYQEAADVLSCPIGTVRSRVARARVDLLRAIEPAVSDHRDA